MAFWKALFGDEGTAALKSAQFIVGAAAAHESATSALSDEALKSKTAEFRQRLSAGATLDELAPEAFAAVREAARRTLSQRHFDVQLVGGMVIHSGGIAEMRPGDG